MKRGQTTVFIIVAILIAAAILLFFIMADTEEIEEPDEVDVSGVHSYTKYYIEDIPRKCLEKVGSHGGYNEIPREIQTLDTAYWYYEGVNIQPFISKFEQETNNCLDSILKNSTDLILEQFNQTSPIRIDKDRIESNISIQDKVVYVDVYYPITLSDGGSTSIVSSFKTEYRLDFYKLYELATGIINHASLPEFDKCEPTQCSSGDISFTFFNEGDDLIIKGQTFIVLEDDTREPYEMKFAVKRPIKEAFGEDKKKLAVLYQEDKDWPTFGQRTVDLLNTLDLNDGTDFYDCDEIPGFFNKIDEYDVIIITGNLQYQIVLRTLINSETEEEDEESSFYPKEGGKLIHGCNSFNPANRKRTLKNWVNNGGTLWINHVNEHETDNFVISYLGSMGYKGGGWKNIGLNLGFKSMQDAVIDIYKESKKSISSYQITDPSSPILTCPNDISNEIPETGYYASLQVTQNDEIIIGDIDGAILWTHKLGKGIVVFDQFVLKDNMFNEMGLDDDIHSKGISQDYFINVLNYVAKFEEYAGAQTEISLISPMGDSVITEPLFDFTSQLPKNTYYSIYIVDQAGRAINLELNDGNSEIIENRFTANLEKTLNLSNLNNGSYEWSVLGSSNGINYFSNIESFIKIEEVELSESGANNQTENNQTEGNETGGE